VKLVQFGSLTEKELRSLMTDIQAEKPAGVILDLRNNPGGLLHAAQLVLSNFLPKGSSIATIAARSQKYDDVTEDEPTIASTVPVVVLVNGGSASASEIVAGALQDYKRATIVGEKTFGKGTVQQIVEFRDGSGLKMTIAEWLTPKGRKIDGVGVTPDVVIALSTDRDEQLLKAVSIIRERR
jgi:carboxyl-terminal processing protease